MKVAKYCGLTSRVEEMEINITPDKLQEVYNRGNKLIQNIVPELSADEREFLMTGIRPEVWADIFGKDEDDGQPDEAQEWHDYDPDC